MSLFAKLVEKLRATPDGDGTLLDHCILVYGCGMGDGDHHTPFDLPVALVGGGAGRLAGNRHLKYPLHTPFMNLGLSLLEKVDVEVERIDEPRRASGPQPIQIGERQPPFEVVDVVLDVDDEASVGASIPGTA